jgi:hypothetical protein
MLQILKGLAFCDAQKSSQEFENRGVNTFKGGTCKGSDRKRESLGEMDSLALVVKRGEVDP